MNKYIPISIAVLTALFTGCASHQPYSGSRAIDKAAIGSVIGGATGAVIGHQSDETEAGAAIGAATGAGIGYVLGNEQDKRLARSQGQGRQKVVVRQPSGGGNRGITCRPPRPRGDVYGYERRSYSRETYHGTNRPRYRPRYRDYVPAGAPPPRPRR